MHGATLKLSCIIHKIIEINSNEQLPVREKKRSVTWHTSYRSLYCSWGFCRVQTLHPIMDRSDHLIFLLEESRNSVRSLPLALSLFLCHMWLPSWPYTLSFLFLLLCQCFSLPLFCKICTSSPASFIIQYECVHEGLSQSPSLDRSAYIGNTLLLMHAHSCILSTASLNIHKGAVLQCCCV